MSIALLIYSFIFIAFVVLKINGIDASNNKEYSGTIGYVIIGVMILMFFLSLLSLKKAYEKTDLMVIGLKEMTFASALSDLVIIEEFVYRLDFMIKDFLLLNSIHSYFPLAVGVAMTSVSISMIFRVNPCKTILPSTMSLVVPSISVTIAFSSSNKAFNKLLFPTLGRPNIPTFSP